TSRAMTKRVEGSSGGSSSRTRSRCLRLEPSDDEVDHLIQAGYWLVGALRDQLRMEETDHSGRRAGSGKTGVGDLKLASCDTIRDDLRYDAGDAIQMRPADIPILFHRDGDHVMHFRIADVAFGIHPMDGRKKQTQPFDGIPLLLRDRLRCPLYLPHE